MGDFLSILYTVVDTLSLIFFLDAFATRRWDNWKFKLGVGCFIALLCWVLQVPFVFFGRDPAIKIGMIILAYTISARVLYKEISNSMLLLLVCIEYLVTYYLSFGLGMMGAFICGMDGEAFRSNFPLAMVYGGINYSAELFLTFTFRKVMRQRRLSKKSNNLTSAQSLLYFLFPSTSFFEHGKILFLRHLYRERQHDAPGKLGVPLVLHGFHGVPEGCPVCISGRRMGRQHDLSVDKFFLLVVEFRFLVVLTEQPFAALVSGPGNSGLSLAALDDGNFEMRTRNRHHPQTKRPPSKIALDERSGIVFGCAHRLRTECYALRS